MKRLFLVALLLGAGAFAARAQSVYAYSDTEYESGCNSVVGTTEEDIDYIAEYYYAVQYSNSMFDNGPNGGTYSQSSGADSAVFEADNVPYGDTFNTDAQVNATLDPWEDACGVGSCGQYCSFRDRCEDICWCNFCPFEDCPAGDMYYNLSSTDNTSTSTNTCGDGDLNKLMNEYNFPSSFGISWNGPLNWVPNCSSFTQSNPTPYSISFVFSGGPISTWGIFQTPMLAGIGNINNTTVPTQLNGLGLPTQPIQVFTEADVVYRTPVENWTQNHAHPNEPHQFGLAIDFASDSGDWTVIAEWAEWANGAQPGATLSSLCVEPQSAQKNSAGHVHVDWRPSEPGSPSCPMGWIMTVPGTWPSH